jgi:DNA-binding PadR family transcriptional regulator
MKIEYLTTNSELAILGLVAETPLYGYEVEKTVTKRGIRQWTEIGFSSIYHILNKLEKNGLLQAEMKMGGTRPARRIYQITPLGLNTLKEEISRRLAAPRPSRGDLELVLASLILLTPAEIVQGFNLLRQNLSNQLEQVITKWNKDRQDPNFPAHVNELFDHSAHSLKAEIDWLENYIKRMQRIQNSHLNP